MRKILLLIFTALLASHGQLLGQCANNDNRCLDFDPTSPSDYVQTTTSPVAGNSNFTVEARFLCTSTGTSTRRLFAFAGGTNNRFEISESGGALRFVRQVVGGSVTTSGITSPNVRDNAWHHLAATRNGTTVRVYLDGTQVYSTTGFVGDLNTTTFRIGASVLSVGATFHWDGRIDEVRVWDVERTAQQINQFRLCWVPCTSTGLKAYYQFNHGVGGGNNTGITVLEDCNDQISGILNDFTLMGSNSNWVCSNDSAFTNGICCTAAFNVSQQTCGEVDFLNTTNGNFTYSWNFGDGSTSDQTSPTHVYSASGTYTVTLTATPVPTGAPCSVQQTITVVADNVPPTVNCRNATINYSGGLVAIIPNVVHLSSSDNCCASNNITLSLSGQTVFDCSDVCQTRTVTLVATDCVGNTATCTATITVNDAEPPIAVCKNVNVGIGSPGTFTIVPNDVNDGSTDNCLPLNLSVSPNMFTCPTQGCEQVHIVTLQATDCAGNTSTCTAHVTVQDVIGPVFVNCPIGGNLIVIDLPPNECVTPNFFTVPATDNCDMTLDMSFEMTGATNISGPGNGEGEPLFAGFTTITYLANDDCGNTGTCVFNVLVRDNQPPFIACPPNMTVQGSTANGGATVNLPTAIIQDNCPGVTVTSSHASGSLFPCGNTVVIYAATDQNGNSATCTTTVTVDCSAGPTCECGTFSGLTLGPKGGKVIQLACGQNSNVPCPVAGTSFEVKGSFACNPTTCAPSNMTWTIKNSDGLTVASGTMAASPFTLAVAGSAMSTPDTYTLTLGADCGITGCARCVIQLKVNECPPAGGGVFACGEAIFSCFSGWTNPNHGWILSDNDPAIGNGLVKDDVVLAMADIRKHADAVAAYTNPSNNWATLPPKYMHPDWVSGKMGQVFGIAIDNTQNVYVGATAIHGQLKPGSLPGAGAGTIYKIDATSGTPSVWANLPNSLTINGNIRSGLGDLAYDPDHNCLFVSNFHDGKVYRLSMSGTVLQAFDPPLGEPLLPGQGFHDPSALPASAKLGQRIWGIGYHKNRLYFGVWVEGQGALNGARDNELWSVPLSTGAFTGATNVNGDFYDLAVLERSFPEYSPSPISDLAFSCDDDIVICTKGRSGDVHINYAYFAHQSTVWRIALSNIGGPMNKYFVGMHWMRTNTSGGVDVGYGSFDPSLSSTPTVFDDKIWVTGDALVFPTSPTVYGLAGLPFAGNTFVNTIDNSILIDADGTTQQVKTFYGDVEIFKCLACPASVPPECDFISASVKPAKSSQEDCCYAIRLNNTVPNFFSSINIQMVEGATLNYPTDVTINTGWVLNAFASGSSVQLNHSSGFVPTGNSFPVRICLSNIDKPVQVFVVQYLDAQDLVICADTLKVTCDFCATVSQDSIRCTDGGLQQLTFCIEAADNLGYSIQSVVLTPPPGVTFTPKAFTIFPPLAPGDPCRTITTTVDLGSSGVAGELCYTVTVHEADITKGIPPLRCCMIDHCTTLPDCLCDSTLTYATFERATPLAEGLCCYNIVLHQPDGAFVSVETEVVSTGSTLSGVGSDPNWDGTFITPKDVWWTPDPSSTLPAVTTLPTLCFGGEAPQVLEITWMTADSLFCQDYLQFNCTDYDCAVFDSVSMTCNVFGGSAVTFQFTVTNLSGLDANQVALVNMSPAGVITGQTIFSVSLPDGATSPILTTTLNNSVGTEACFQVNLYYKNPNDSLDIKDCCLTDTLCFIMPRCTLPNAIQPIIAFPNPTRDEVIVYFSEGSPANGYLRVLDLTGRILREESVPTSQNAHKTSLRDYPPGLYFIEVTEGQQRIWSSKVVRQGWD